MKMDKKNAKACTHIHVIIVSRIYVSVSLHLSVFIYLNAVDRKPKKKKNQILALYMDIRSFDYFSRLECYQRKQHYYILIQYI